MHLTTELARTEKHLVTCDEFFVRITEEQKADLIDGVIHMASPESLEGNELVFWLARLIADFVEATDRGKVFIERVAFRLAKHQMPEPDVAFVARDRLHLARYGYFDGPPDLAIEVVSPESGDRDYRDKRKQYQTAGVREYWIIDEELTKVTLLKLSAAGEFVEVEPADGRLDSSVLPGFHLRPEWIFSSPRPSKAKILASLLPS